MMKEGLFRAMLPGRDSYLQLKDVEALCPFQPEDKDSWAACYEIVGNQCRTLKHAVWFLHELGYHEDFYYEHRLRRNGDISKEQWALLVRLVQSVCQLEHDLRLALWDPRCEILPPTRAVYFRLRFWQRKLRSGDIDWDWVLDRYLFYPGSPSKKMLQQQLNMRLEIERKAEHERGSNETDPAKGELSGECVVVPSGARLLH